MRGWSAAAGLSVSLGTCSALHMQHIFLAQAAHVCALQEPQAVCAHREWLLRTCSRDGCVHVLTLSAGLDTCSAFQAAQDTVHSATCPPACLALAFPTFYAEHVVAGPCAAAAAAASLPTRARTSRRVPPTRRAWSRCTGPATAPRSGASWRLTCTAAHWCGLLAFLT